MAIGSAATLAGGATGASLLALLMAASPASAVGTTYTVDTLDDGAANSSDCTTPVANSCSLRDALGAVTSGDTIVFASGLTGTINLDANVGEMEIGSDIVLQGPGADLLTVDAGGNSRVFYVCGGSDTEIAGLTISGGSASQGGGLYDECGNGTTLRNVVVTGNQASAKGGGLYSNGPMTIIDSVISNNSAADTGGGLMVSGDLIMSGSIVSGNSSVHGGGGAWVSDSITISDSTFDLNTAGYCGGGLYAATVGEAITITGSTFSNNSADNCYGGAIDIDGNYNTVVIANTTITGNSANAGGGAHFDYGNYVTLAQDTIVGNSSTSTDSLYSGGGVHFTDRLGTTFELSGTIISGNSAAAGPADIGAGDAQMVSATMTANDSLLGEVDSRITVAGAGNVSSTTPGVGALANNGGPTKTMALLADSAALDAGPATVATFPGNTYDQRGAGFARVVGTRADIGAFEAQAPEPEPTTTTTASSEPVVPAFTG